jgi:hypothetical protein
MTSPAIVSLLSGQKPTEPGWYMIFHEKRGREIIWISGYSGGLAVMMTDGSSDIGIAGLISAGYTFIARILPERIESGTKP